MNAGPTPWESTSGPQIKSQAQQGSQTAADSHARPLRVLWVGEPELARDHLAQEAPHMQFAAVPTTPEQLSRALGNLGSAAEPRFDVLVIDTSSPDFNPISALEDARARGLDVPVLLLIQPGDEKRGAQALNAGADDYIIKTSGYVRRLLPALESLVFRHEPTRADEVRSSGETHLKSIVESQPTCVTVVANDGRVLAINAAGLELVGAQRLDQVVGQTFSDFVAPEDHDLLGTFIQRVCGGEKSSLEYSLLRLDGARRIVETRAVPLSRQMEGTVSALGVTEDVTDRRFLEGALRESEGRFTLLADCGTAAVFILQGTQLRYVNRIMEGLTGHSSDELLSGDLGAIVHNESLAEVQSRELARQNGQTVESPYEIKIRAKGDQIVQLELHATLIEFEGSPAVWMCPESCRKASWRKAPADWLTTLPRYAA